MDIKALPGIKDYRDAEANNVYLKEMKEYGFEIDTIPYYDLRKLTKTFKNYHNATLSTLFYACFFSEKISNEAVLYDMANKIPRLIKVIDETNIGRGHNGKKDFDSSELKFLKENVDNTINSLIDFMVDMNL